MKTKFSKANTLAYPPGKRNLFQTLRETFLFRMQNLLREPHHNMGLISDWNNATVDRVIDIISGSGEQWNRAGNRYRDHASHEKYQVVKIEK